MLQRLSIQHYTIIAQLEITFSPGLNIITGETGAGKSVLLGALSLILGERADSGILPDKEKKCIIEGVFIPPPAEAVREFFDENGLDWEEHILIRREVTANGKSRAFINDTPVTLQQLNILSRFLVDLHQQFDTLQLSQPAFQREVLDALCNHSDLLQQYKKIYRQYLTCQQQCQLLKEQIQQSNKEMDYTRFLHDELSQADFREQEAEQLEEELKTLTHAETIRQSLEQAYYTLQDAEQPAIASVKQVISALQGVAGYQQQLPQLLSRLSSACIELQDIAGELAHISSQVQYDAERINEVNERLSLAYRLFKKHGLHTTAELLQLQAELLQRLDHVQHLDEELIAAEKERDTLLLQLQDRAAVISGGRKKQAAPFEKKVNGLLSQVGMPNAKLKVDLHDTSLNEFGADAIEFLFDANNNGQLLPLRKVASGGEVSRLMLCIKSLVAASVDLPTLIFDEIDSGISGEAARQVGIIMKNLSKTRQVICITHQPQIASKADVHYFVFKETRKGKTMANIRLLDHNERISAIAQMLGGEQPTAAAVENAREMIGH